jgi:hypothetical protein
MAMMYCTVCQKPVRTVGGFGLIDLVLTVITCGIWLIIAFFKSKKCPMCRNSGTLQKL